LKFNKDIDKSGLILMPRWVNVHQK